MLILPNSVYKSPHILKPTLHIFGYWKATCVKSCELQSSTRTSRAKSPLSFPPGELEFRQTLIDDTIGCSSLELKLKTVLDKYEWIFVNKENYEQMCNTQCANLLIERNSNRKKVNTCRGPIRFSMRIIWIALSFFPFIQTPIVIRLKEINEGQ